MARSGLVPRARRTAWTTNAITEHGGGDHVDHADVAHERQHECRGEHDDTLYTTISRTAALLALHHRQHRDAGRRVVVAVPQRERPEVRRCPEEHDREQHPGRGLDRAGDRMPTRRAPAPHRPRRRSRCSAGSAASARSCTRTRRTASPRPRAAADSRLTRLHSSAKASASSTRPNTSAPLGLDRAHGRAAGARCGASPGRGHARSSS